MYVYILISENTSLSILPQHLLTNSIFPIFLIVCSGISVSFRYSGFILVNLGTGSWLVVDLFIKCCCFFFSAKTDVFYSVTFKAIPQLRTVLIQLSTAKVRKNVKPVYFLDYTVELQWLEPRWLVYHG